MAPGTPGPGAIAPLPPLDADRQYLHALEKMALQYSSSLRSMKLQCEKLRTAWVTQCVLRRRERCSSSVFGGWAHGAGAERQKRKQRSALALHRLNLLRSTLQLWRLSCRVKPALQMRRQALTHERESKDGKELLRLCLTRWAELLTAFERMRQANTVSQIGATRVLARALRSRPCMDSPGAEGRFGGVNGVSERFIYRGPTQIGFSSEN